MPRDRDAEATVTGINLVADQDLLRYIGTDGPFDTAFFIKGSDKSVPFPRFELDEIPDVGSIFTDGEGAPYKVLSTGFIPIESEPPQLVAVVFLEECEAG